MKYRRLGRTGFDVSEISHGLWGMSGWSGSEDQESLEAMQLAVDLGCNFFDTAWAYGNGKSDELLGQILAKNRGKRLYAASKIPPQMCIRDRASGVLFLFIAGWVLAQWAMRTGWRAMTAPLTLLVTQFLWFVLPTALELGYRMAVPQTRYSSGILAVLHSAQYLWITSYYARREAVAAGGAAWRMGKYFATLIAGGIAPVSYTHLDVYKRQLQSFLKPAFARRD